MRVTDWFKMNKLKVNEGNTVNIPFNLKNKVELPDNKYVKLYGLFLDNRLTLDTQKKQR